MPAILDHHVFVDLETTGLDPSQDEVIEVGALFISQGEVVQKITRLFKPSKPLPLVIKRLTGLDDQQLAHQPDFKSYLPELAEDLRGWTVIAHNAGFEKSFLHTMLESIDAPVLDSCLLLHLLHPEWPSHSLESMVQRAGIANHAAHRALQDCEDTHAALNQVLQQCIEDARSDDLHELIQMLTAGEVPYAQRALVEVLTRLEAVTRTRRPALSLTPTGGPMHRHPERRKQSAPAMIDPRAMVDTLLGPGGALEGASPTFVSRPEQQALAQEVLANFENKHTLALEAGTGTGKSLGYLAPAAVWASQKQERVLVAPHTRALQDQLVENDLPKLHRALGGSFGYAVLKGQSNYACLRRSLEATRVSPEMTWDERLGRAYVRQWLKRSPHGEVDHLSYWFRGQAPSLEQLMPLMRSEPSTSIGKLCPHYESCFFHGAVGEAAEADVIVANQSLAFSWPERYPKAKHLLLDEAHEAEDVATEAWSQHLSMHGLSAFHARLLRLKKKLLEAGLSAVAGRMTRACNELLLDLKGLNEASLALIPPPLMKVVPGQQGQAPTSPAPQFKDEELWIDDEVRKGRGWLRVRAALHGLLASLELVLQSLPEADGRLHDPSALREVDAARTAAQEFAAVAESLVHRPNAQRCDHVSVRDEAFHYRLSPLEVGPKFSKEIEGRYDSLTLVSATLSVSPEEPWVLPRLGLAEGNKPVRFVRHDSPFDLQHQALVVLVTDAPDPQHPEFIDWATGRLSGLAKFLGGRTLGLFASNQRLEAVSQKLTKELDPHGIEVMRQKRGTAAKLAARQTEDLGTVLLGTRTYWQGIDVPGPGVSCVFIDKLPLEPSSRPMVAARERLAGLNAPPPPPMALGSESPSARNAGFLRYRLPRALLQLRQGVGRLVRSPTDRGIVLIAAPGAAAYRPQLMAALHGYRVLALDWQHARVALHKALLEMGLGPEPEQPQAAAVSH